MAPAGKSGSNGFQALGLSDPIYRGIIRMGFRNPTPVQRKSIPVIMTGNDTVVMARTGSGKTCAFLIPLLEKLLLLSNNEHRISSSSVRAVIISPTRELSLQTLKVLKKLSHFMLSSNHNNNNLIKAIGIHGGESMEKQFEKLSMKPNIIVATPGRLSHHLSEITDFTLLGCCMMIMDEADRLIEMGFIQQLKEIISSTIKGDNCGYCQKVLLSATMPKGLLEFTKSGFLSSSDPPQVVRLDTEASVSADLRISFITCRSSDKDATLLHILQQIIFKQQQGDLTKSNDDDEDTTSTFNNKKKKNNKKRRRQDERQSPTPLTLIFAATRHHVEYISCLLQASNISSTMIYGTLDQEARKQHLSKFRSGQIPVLIVTDVAARGLDIPHLDHVIHYHFPSTSKLFVHRSGRVARASRIGYCWTMVEPEEMPYMVDLHLFLGRPLRTSNDCISSADANNNNKKTISYSLNDMTPDMVHYGSVPESILVRQVEHVERILHSELTAYGQNVDTIQALTKVCNNAMKQYRKSRPEASRQAVWRAKAILEGEKLQSGERNSSTGGYIPPHPLLIHMMEQEEEQQQQHDNVNQKNGMESMNMKKCRQDFLQAMARFRPRETVFEAFATSGGKDIGVVSHLDKGRTTMNSKSETSAAALFAMKNMRRQMKMARNKGTSLVVAGSTNAHLLNGDEDEEDDVVEKEPSTSSNSKQKHEEKPIITATPSTILPSVVDGKRRMSKAERKRRKKGGLAGPDNNIISDAKKTKNKRGKDFRDEGFYMENELTSEEAIRSRHVEAAMQPSATTNKGSTAAAALRLEEAMLDVMGDEHSDLAQRQRMVRWDKSKRKYIQSTVGMELSGMSKTKKLRLESGQLVKSNKLKLGELYEKWQKKTNRSIGRSGVFDEEDIDHNGGGDSASMEDMPSYNKAASSAQGGKPPSSNNLDRPKTAAQIRRERERKKDMKIKNMKKSDRKRLEQKMRADRKDKAAAKARSLGRYGKKKGPTGRWNTNLGKRRSK